MKNLTAAVGIAMLFASPAVALDLDWNGDPEPETPVEPEPEVPPTITTTTTESRDAWPRPEVHSCCVRDGAVVARRNPFMSIERTQRMCERVLVKGNAVILECPGDVSPEALK
jgi:hypothetical protein